MMNIERPGEYPVFSGWPESRELFKKPPDDFRPSVYWLMGKDTHYARLKANLKRLTDAGVSCFWIQVHLGYPLEKYLSPEFFNLYRKVLDEARELKLHAGIYDEYEWFSGHGGGKTVHDDHGLRERQLFWVESTLSNGRAIEKKVAVNRIRSLFVDLLKETGDWLYDGGDVEWGEWEVVGAYTYDKRDGEIVLQSVNQVSDRILLSREGKDGCELTLSGPFPKESSEILIFVQARAQNSHLIDYLNPEATKRFISVSYELFRKNIGNYFRDPVYGIFFDEPAAGFYTWGQQTGALHCSLMYNEDFFREFEKSYNYDFLDYLHALIYPVGALTARFRCDFFEAYSNRIIESFIKPLSKWAESNGLDFLGHELCTDINSDLGFAGGPRFFDSLVNHGCNYFSIGECKTICTTDSGVYSLSLSAKMGSSISHVKNKKGSMLEQFTTYREGVKNGESVALGNWDLPISLLRHQANRYAIQGLSKLIISAFYESNEVDPECRPLRSQRFHFPPGINFEPWFKYFKIFSTEDARLRYFLSLGQHKAPVVVMYPLRSYWADPDDIILKQETAFWHEQLMRKHYDYDIINEEDFLDATIGNGMLTMGFETYKCVVLPGLSTLKSDKTVEKLSELCKSGGKLIISGQLPYQTQKQGYDEQVRAAIAALIKDENAHYFSRDENNSSIGFMDTMIKRDISIIDERGEAEDVFYAMREDKKTKYVALLNDSEEPKRIKIHISGQYGLVRLWDLETGDIAPWCCGRIDSSSIETFITMKAQQAVCLSFEEGDAHTRITETNGDIMYTSLSSGGFETSILSVGARCVELSLQTELEDPAVECSGYNPVINHFNNEVAILISLEDTLSEIELSPLWAFRATGSRQWTNLDTARGWELQGYEDYAGEGRYRQKFTVSEKRKDIRFFLSARSVYHTLEVYLNGHLCGIRPWPPYIVDITEHVEYGTNLLELRVSNTAGNFMYAGTPHERKPKAVSGLVGAVKIIPLFEIKINVREGG